MEPSTWEGGREGLPGLGLQLTQASGTQVSSRCQDLCSSSAAYTRVEKSEKAPDTPGTDTERNEKEGLRDRSLQATNGLLPPITLSLGC